MQKPLRYKVNEHERGATEPPANRARPQRVDDGGFASANQAAYAISQQDLAEQVAQRALARGELRDMQRDALQVNQRLMQTAPVLLGDKDADDEDDEMIQDDPQLLRPCSLAAVSEATASSAQGGAARPPRKLVHKGTPLARDGALCSSRGCKDVLKNRDCAERVASYVLLAAPTRALSLWPRGPGEVHVRCTCTCSHNSTALAP